MAMIDTLKFVRGAVAKKELVPAMTHFCIEGGLIRAFNGMLALGSPIDFNIDCKPKAVDLVAAITACPDNSVPVLSMTDAGRLKIHCAAFKGYIDCVNDADTPHVMPEGNEVAGFNGELMLRALQVVEDFIGTDASRAWSTGVLLRGASALATNNVMLIECWVGAQWPVTVNIPRSAVAEILRIGVPPIRAQMADRNITFHYEDGRWLRTQLLQNDWPDTDKILNVHSAPAAVPSQLFDGLEAVEHAVDKMGRVWITGGVIRTTLTEGEGATYDVPDIAWKGVYQVQMLQKLKGVADVVDFTLYPQPCIWYGEHKLKDKEGNVTASMPIRGAIVGMRGLETV